MSLRTRLTLVATVVVAAAVALCSVIVYLVMRSDLRGEVDDGLRRSAALIQQRPESLRRFDNQFFQRLPQPGFGAPREYIQLVTAAGVTTRPPGGRVTVPVSERTIAVAAASAEPFLADATVSGVHARVITVPLAEGVALQLARPLNEVDGQLSQLGLILLLVSLGGVAVAAAAGALVSRATLAPVRRMTEAAERITKTRDPVERVAVTGKDELSRLAATFDRMLAALHEAIETQRRFVADASHELRTPLTSLQTNIAVLLRGKKLSSEQRDRIHADLDREAQEMQGLVAGLLELARGSNGHQARELVQLDELAADCVERARARFPEVRFELRAEPTLVEGAAERLERAVWNLLENAGKWSPAGGKVEVTLEGGELRVRDQGPGIAAEDKPHIFERFYRATVARAMPGAGLGLAIVSDVAQAHDGSVAAEDPEGGGALLRLRLPVTRGDPPG